MNPSKDGRAVVVVGSGTMGTGIAQVAVMSGHAVALVDKDEAALEKAAESLRNRLERLVVKGRIDRTECSRMLERLSFTTDLSYSANAGLVVEAVVEDIAVKVGVFTELEANAPDDCILATNTSSLSITEIAAACSRPSRVLGMHFFNPAPLLPLVEVVPALQTDADLPGEVVQLLRDWNKVPVVARDLPGFIVNRVARPFYGEALRILEEGFADHATIDWAMREIGGFRMGPFELMDLIGNDVNFAVTAGVHDAFFGEPRYRPSITQLRMVQSGRLGRKSGRGYYDYSDGASPTSPGVDATVGRLINDRITAMLMNEAVDAVFWGVASPADIDLAMTTGVNYPRGLLAWIDDVGPRWPLEKIRSLQDRYGEDRYRPSPLLLDHVSKKLRFHAS